MNDFNIDLSQNNNFTSHICDIDNTSNISQNDDTDYDNLCVICVENISCREMVLSCNHKFHIICITKWFNRCKKNVYPSICPICKHICNHKIFIKNVIKYNINYLNLQIKDLNFSKKYLKNSVIYKFKIHRLKTYYLQQLKKYTCISIQPELLEIPILTIPLELQQLIINKKREFDEINSLSPKKYTRSCNNWLNNIIQYLSSCFYRYK